MNKLYYRLRNIKVMVMEINHFPKLLYPKPSCLNGVFPLFTPPFNVFVHLNNLLFTFDIFGKI